MVKNGKAKAELLKQIVKEVFENLRYDDVGKCYFPHHELDLTFTEEEYKMLQEVMKS